MHGALQQQPQEPATALAVQQLGGRQQHGRDHGAGIGVALRVECGQTRRALGLDDDVAPLEHGHHQLVAVAEVVVDGGRVAMAGLVGDGAQRDGVDASLVEQPLGRVEQPRPTVVGPGIRVAHHDGHTGDPSSARSSVGHRNGHRSIARGLSARHVGTVPGHVWRRMMRTH